MMKSLILLLLCCIMGVSSGQDLSGTPPGCHQPGTPVMLIAHRGESFIAPENTLASFRLAYESGAESVELDCHLSADQRVVVLHDANTRRTTGKHYVVKDTDSEVLRTLDAGSFKGTSFAGERIPYLEEAIALIPPGRSLVVELKSGMDLLPAVEKIVRECGKKDQLIFIAFDWNTIAAVHELFPENCCYWLSNLKEEVKDRMEEAAGIGLDGLNLHFSVIDSALMQQAGHLGLDILAWTVDDPKEARRLAGLGVKAVTTNRTAWMKEQLGW